MTTPRAASRALSVRHAIAGPFLQRRPVGGDRLLQPRRPALARRERHERSAAIVLRRGPVERLGPAWGEGQCAAVDADRLHERLIVAEFISMVVEFTRLSQHILPLGIRVCVSNKGPLIEGDTETLFGPFESTRAGPSSEHQGLGLYLVRLIAVQHGGTAVIANLGDGSGVRATIRLPLNDL
jgi:Histidine kinase-, DNA gyrase B-, and HSP90-like ATPase